MKAFELTIDGGPIVEVSSFEIVERTHVESRARVVARYTAPWSEIDSDALLGAKATLEILLGDSTRPSPRRFHGVVDEIELDRTRVTLTLVARVMPLADGCDHRVFLDKDSVTIAEDLLEEASLKLDVRVGARPDPRVQCVQAFESPLAFVLRILAEDGVSLWVEHTEDEDVVVIANDGSAVHDLPGGATLPMVYDSGTVGAEAITKARLTRRLTSDGASVGDYDPDHPTLDLNAAVGAERYGRFVYPGHHTSPDAGKKRAQRILEEGETYRVILRARTSCRHVAVGFAIEVTDSTREEENGRFRVLEVHHRGYDATVEDGAHVEGERPPLYESELVAVPLDTPVRPKPARPRGLGGLQTMTITGASGQEIHTEAQGRVRAHFRYDRLRPNDETSSAWIRPTQPALSGGLFLPRVGWEVLCGFMSDPVPTGDTPIEMGRMIHGQAPPAESLPGQKVRSNWGTSTTPGGGKMNQLRFDDAAGSEGMALTASHDFNERTENDKVSIVTADESVTVGGSHKQSVTLQLITHVDGSQSYTVGSNRTLTTTGIYSIVAASELVVVGGTRTFQIGGDYETKCASLARIVGALENVVAIQEQNRHVTGASTISVGATWVEVGGLHAAAGVLGAATLVAAGPMSTRASKVSINATTLTEKYAALFKTHAAGDFTVGAAAVNVKAGGSLSAKGADVFFKADTRINIKAGGVKITIEPGSIKVKGKVKGDGPIVVTTKEEVK